MTSFGAAGAEIARDPQVAANDMFVPLEHPRFGRLRTVDSPIIVAGEPKMPARAAPELGEHTEAVLAELGYSPAAIVDLLDRGIAVQRPHPRAVTPRAASPSGQPAHDGQSQEETPDRKRD